MKKALVFGLIGVLIGAVAFAAINTAIKTGKPHGNITFNVDVGTDGTPDYYPIQINLDMPTITTSGRETGQATVYFNVGTNQATPFEFDTLADHQEVYTALPPWAQAAYRSLVIEAKDEDPS